MLLLDLGHFASIEPFLKGVSSHTRRDAERSVAVRWIATTLWDVKRGVVSVRLP